MLRVLRIPTLNRPTERSYVEAEQYRNVLGRFRSGIQLVLFVFSVGFCVCMCVDCPGNVNIINESNKKCVPIVFDKNINDNH